MTLITLFWLVLLISGVAASDLGTAIGLILGGALFIALLVMGLVICVMIAAIAIVILAMIAVSWLGCAASGAKDVFRV